MFNHPPNTPEHQIVPLPTLVPLLNENVQTLISKCEELLKASFKSEDKLFVDLVKEKNLKANQIKSNTKILLELIQQQSNRQLQDLERVHKDAIREFDSKQKDECRQTKDQLVGLKQRSLNGKEAISIGKDQLDDYKALIKIKSDIISKTYADQDDERLNQLTQSIMEWTSQL